MMDTKPTTDIDSKTVLSDADGLNVALNGVYATLYNRIDFVTANAHQCFGVPAVVLAADLMGEDMVQEAQGAGWFWHDYNYEERQRYASKIYGCYFRWKYFYQIIGNVNYIISAENTASGDSTEIENIMGQAYSLRAYAYFMLIQSYQQTYVGHESLPGVPIYTDPTTSSTEGAGRGTVSDTYAQIDSDINKGIALLEESGMDQDHKSHLDYYAANLLKARIALVENRWNDAAEASAIAMKKPGCTLLTRAQATVVKGTFDDNTFDWTTGSTPFNSISSPDVMWGAEQLSEQSNVYASLYSMMDACTNVYYAAESPKCISNWLYSQIPSTDIRKGWWNGDIGKPLSSWKYGANINYNQFKFQWRNQEAHTGDIVFMRMEEAYLINAEALCKLQDFDGARNSLVEVGSRRDTSFAKRVAFLTGSEQTFASVGKVTTLYDEIILQRRIELWGETGRMFDILRLAKGFTRYWYVDGMITNHVNYLSKYAEYLDFPADYMECIFLIPQAEIDINPKISAEDQNPYVLQ
jgi:hypothetical protein